MKFKTQGKLAIAILIIALSAGAIFLLKALAPEADVTPRVTAAPAVNVVTVDTSAAPVQIVSQGIIEAPKETALASEVGGNIISVSERFDAGEDFEEGDILIEIEPADYAAALAQAEANVADATLNLALEQGRARQAVRDWKSVGRTEDPSELVLRAPHLKSAESKLISAKAAVEKAQRDMERTKIRAPYDCRIRTTYTEVGSFVAPGARIADVYELDGFEVRLPIALDDYAFIEGSGIGSKVTLSTTIAGQPKSWEGTIVRDEGVIDRSSRSVYLVAKIEASDGEKFLSPGLFVKASIIGRTLENIIELPRKALYGTDTVYVIDAEDKLRFRTIEVARTETGRVLVRSGLEAGDRVCIDNLAAAINGMVVEVLDDQPEDLDEGAGTAAEPASQETPQS
ncbi:MAG: efflux RND transporter periplasmic adaptor subunit [Verrucomicrobiales bacterium]